MKSFYARLVMAGSCLVGLFASVYLFYTYVTGSKITCVIVSGCEIVRASKWAYTFGIPRPLLGIVFYVTVLATLVLRASIPKYAKWLKRLTIAASVLGLIESTFLFLVQWLDIKAFCFWCLTSGVMATILFIAMFFDREASIDHHHHELRVYLYLLIAWLIIGFPLFVYLTR